MTVGAADIFPCARTVVFMTYAFQKVYKSSAYCPTMGVCLAKSADGARFTLPVDKPVRANVSVNVESSDPMWTSLTHQQWAQDARELWLAASLPQNVNARIAFTELSPASTGMAAARAAAIAAVIAVARAAEFPLTRQRITDAEQIVGNTTGLAWGTPVILSPSGATPVNVGPRQLWLWLRPVSLPEDDPQDEYGVERSRWEETLKSPVSLRAQAGAHPSQRVAFATELCEALATAGVENGVMIGSVTPERPVAVLLDPERVTLSQMQRASSELRKVIPLSHLVDVTRSAVPSTLV
jgi:hypothetical protein